MGIKIKSGLEPGYQNKDLLDLFDVMQGAIDRLEVLGQIQAAVGGMSMEARAGDTFNCQATLENFLAEIKHGVIEAIK